MGIGRRWGGGDIAHWGRTEKEESGVEVVEDRAFHLKLSFGFHVLSEGGVQFTDMVSFR